MHPALICMHAAQGMLVDLPAVHCCAILKGTDVVAIINVPLEGYLTSACFVLGLLHRPTPTTDPLGIVAALNWQMSQGGGSEGNGYPVSNIALLSRLRTGFMVARIS